MVSTCADHPGAAPSALVLSFGGILSSLYEPEGRRFASCWEHHTFRGTHMSDEDLKAEVEKLRAENERLKTQRGRSVSLKVSEKGGVSVYGLGRFPVTLYKEQWTKLLAMTDEIRAFLKEHDAELKAKPEA
jgi:hypothetical protein